MTVRQQVLEIARECVVDAEAGAIGIEVLVTMPDGTCRYRDWVDTKMYNDALALSLAEVKGHA